MQGGACRDGKGHEWEGLYAEEGSGKGCEWSVAVGMAIEGGAGLLMARFVLVAS